MFRVFKSEASVSLFKLLNSKPYSLAIDKLSFKEYCKLSNIEEAILRDNKYTVYKCTTKKEMDLYGLDYNYPFMIKTVY